MDCFYFGKENFMRIYEGGKELANEDSVLDAINQHSIPITQIDPSYDLFVPNTTQLMICASQLSRFKNAPKDIAQWPYFFVLYLMMAPDTGVAFLVTVAGEVSKNIKTGNKWGTWKKIS